MMLGLHTMRHRDKMFDPLRERNGGLKRNEQTWGEYNCVVWFIKQHCDNPNSGLFYFDILSFYISFKMFGFDTFESQTLDVLSPTAEKGFSNKITTNLRRDLTFFLV